LVHTSDFHFQGFSGADLSWYFTTTIDADAPESDDLIQIYYDELNKLRPGLPSIEEFREELAVSHIGSICKVIIASDGLDKNDANTVETMSICTRRALNAMQTHGTVAAFEKYLKGELISQKGQAPSGMQVTSTSKGQVAPSS
jgi:hypothetical protein